MFIRVKMTKEKQKQDWVYMEEGQRRYLIVSGLTLVTICVCMCMC